MRNTAINEIFEHIRQHQEVITAIAESPTLIERIVKAVKLSQTSLKNGGKILFCGNGGSAADAQHFAAELVVRLEGDRESLPAIALTTDSSILTATANDYSFEDLFSRQVSSLGNSDDVLICLTTSGNSPNVLKAAMLAKAKGISVISLTGRGGGRIADMSDVLIDVPSPRTMRIQEAHCLILHIWCKLLEGAEL